MVPPPPPPSSTASLFIGLILRLISLAATVTTIGILSSNSVTIEIDSQTQVKGSFKDVYPYRYMLSTAVIGAAYTILQIAFTVFRMSTSNSSSSALFDFFGDKKPPLALSAVHTVGGMDPSYNSAFPSTFIRHLMYRPRGRTAAGFAVTKDLKRAIGLSGSKVDKFFDKGLSSAGLLLLGFVCVAFLSIASSFNLPRKSQ